MEGTAINQEAECQIQLRQRKIANFIANIQHDLNLELTKKTQEYGFDFKNSMPLRSDERAINCEFDWINVTDDDELSLNRQKKVSNYPMNDQQA